MSGFRLLLAATVVLFAVALAGADRTSCIPVPQETYCVYDGQQYEPGDSFPATDGCNTCACGEDGAIACTLMACGCLYEDEWHAYGDTFEAADGCNTCTCTHEGVACTEMACGCLYGDEWHAYGESFPADDGCNTCTCTPQGVMCTLMACGCLYGGQFYLVGESFPATDGCNTCTCMQAGHVACTEMYCPPDDCDPAAEWWRDYIGTPETCPLIHFVCPGDATYFANDCGCGCEQPEDCPEWFNCMPGPGAPPCDVAWIEQHCPYSGIAW